MDLLGEKKKKKKKNTVHLLQHEQCWCDNTSETKREMGRNAFVSNTQSLSHRLVAGSPQVLGASLFRLNTAVDAGVAFSSPPFAPPTPTLSCSFFKLLVIIRWNSKPPQILPACRTPGPGVALNILKFISPKGSKLSQWIYGPAAPDAGEPAGQPLPPSASAVSRPVEVWC